MKDETDEKQRVLDHALRKSIATSRASEIALTLQNRDDFKRGSTETIRRWIDLADALLTSGRITASEYLIYATFGLEYRHDQRWLDGDYPEIANLSAKLNKIEKQYGLKDDEYWLNKDQPQEARILNDEYSDALDLRYERLLREFELHDIADLWGKNRKEYDRQREIGRRSIFEKGNHLAAIQASILVYEKEAQLSARAGAFYAGSVMLGSAAEARILEAVLIYPNIISTALGEMRSQDKPKNLNPLHWSLEHLISVADHAGWITVIENHEVGISVRKWLASLRELRNLLHAGRHARDKPHVLISQAEYTDAQLGYCALKISLANNLPDE